MNSLSRSNVARKTFYSSGSTSAAVAAYHRCLIHHDKAAGADDLVPRFLNSIKHELVSPLVILFRKVLDEETVPRDWK